MQISEIKIGQTVWFHESWTNTIEEAVITDIVSCDHIDYVSLKVLKVGMCNQTLENIYPSKQACEKAVEMKNMEMINSYKKEITDLKALVTFAVTHCIGPSEEYTDYNARKAFIDRAEELIGIPYTLYIPYKEQSHERSK